jgi:hypothetical protein
MKAQKLTLEDIKEALNPVKQAKLRALIEWFEQKGETEMANKLKFWGKPNCIYLNHELQQFAEAFAFLGCEIKIMHTLLEGMIVFSWGNPHELSPPARLSFISESYSSLDGTRKALSLPMQGEPCANPSQLNNGERK